MTKYLITDEYKLYKQVRRNADFAPEHKFMNKLSKDGAIRLFNNPVTAIAYDYNIPSQLDNEYKMDKKDIIKALDFWINDKILENERLLQLNNRLEDFHETELKSLIRIKESVVNRPNNTVFKRFVNTDDMLRLHNMLCSDTVEFYYEMDETQLNDQNRRNRVP